MLARVNHDTSMEICGNPHLEWLDQRVTMRVDMRDGQSVEDSMVNIYELDPLMCEWDESG